jgi:hypothetical protein
LKLRLFATIILILVRQSFGGDNGGYAGANLRMGLGARAIALGNTGVAAPLDAYSAYYNPAAFGNSTRRMVALSYGFLSLDRHQSFVSFSLRVPPAAGFSIGWIESGIGNIQSYNSIGEQTGGINHANNTILFSFGRRVFSRMALGLTVKIMFEDINDGTAQFDYTSRGVGFDLGWQYNVTDGLTLGYQIRDIGSKLKANTEKIFELGGTTIDRFPLIQKAGIYYRTPWPWLRLGDDLEWSNKGDVRNHLGIEAVRGKNLALRLGLNGTHLAFGAGMDFKIGRFDSLLDYAFLPSLIDEGSSHYFSWQIIF